jgi:hypothetical protein
LAVRLHQRGAVEIRALIDTIFGPVLGWLTKIYTSISDLSIPLSRPLNVDKYFGYFGLLGSGWQDFIKTVCALAFVYGIAFIVVTQLEFFRKFKDVIKWW